MVSLLMVQSRYYTHSITLTYTVLTCFSSVLVVLHNKVIQAYHCVYVPLHGLLDKLCHISYMSILRHHCCEPLLAQYKLGKHTYVPRAKLYVCVYILHDYLIISCDCNDNNRVYWLILAVLHYDQQLKQCLVPR